MTRVLVTGATGKVGNEIARLLVARRTAFKAPVRDPITARTALASGIELLAGDVVDRDACWRAVASVDGVFISHQQGVRDPAIFGRRCRPAAGCGAGRHSEGPAALDDGRAGRSRGWKPPGASTGGRRSHPRAIESSA